MNPTMTTRSVTRTDVAAALKHADMNVLRLALLQATGDERLASMRLAATPRRGGSISVAELGKNDRRVLLDVAQNFIERELPTFEPEVPQDSQLRQLMEVFLGRAVTDREFTYLRDIAAFDDFPRAVNWTAQRPTLPNGFSVAIVGAGFSGVAMAIQLKRLGVPFTIYEKRAEVGGTWSSNTYPDARVDTPSLGYQYSFVKNYSWSEYFARGSEVRDYVEHTAREFGVLEHTRFSTEVRTAEFDERTSTWQLRIRNTNGQEETHTAAVVVSASGLFSVPKMPDIPGIDDYDGTLVHTTRWTGSERIKDARVAVIGNGSTGVQILSRLATEARQVSVFQRTPQWINGREGYGEKVPEEVRWLLDTIPYYWNWAFFGNVTSAIQVQDLQVIDREWQSKGGLVSAANDKFRESLLAYMREQLRGNEQLIDKLTPDYPPMARRLVVDNNWYRTLLEDHVELVTEPIHSFTRTGIRTADGADREFDVVVAATGFEVSKYLWPTQYRGRSGQLLHDVWAADRGPRAYLGLMVPDFPNLFILYGPNAQPRAGGSIQSWFETWVRYVGQCIVTLLERDAKTVSVRRDAYERYNGELDERSTELLWMDPNSKNLNYYVNEFGRQQVGAPWPVDEYHSFFQEPNLNDIEFA